MTQIEQTINWTNDGVFRARDRLVMYRDGSTHLIKHANTGGGWDIDNDQTLSILDVRYVLNMNEAVLVDYANCPDDQGCWHCQNCDAYHQWINR